MSEIEVFENFAGTCISGDLNEDERQEYIAFMMPTIIWSVGCSLANRGRTLVEESLTFEEIASKKHVCPHPNCNAYAAIVRGTSVPSSELAVN